MQRRWERGQTRTHRSTFTCLRRFLACFILKTTIRAESSRGIINTHYPLAKTEEFIFFEPEGNVSKALQRVRQCSVGSHFGVLFTNLPLDENAIFKYFDLAEDGLFWELEDCSVLFHCLVHFLSQLLLWLQSQWQELGGYTVCAVVVITIVSRFIRKRHCLFKNCVNNTVDVLSC